MASDGNKTEPRNPGLTRWLNRFRTGRLLLGYYLLQKNFLSPSGWTRSVGLGKPITRSQEALPWFTYPFIRFLEPRLQPGWRVFEFGSGNSTRWFSGKGCTVTSVEHDARWVEALAREFEGNSRVTLLLRDLESGAYAHAIRDVQPGFDLILIDGRDRVACCRNAVGALKPDGVILWDNADRTEYGEGYRFLTEQGFKRLDFFGLGPINSRPWSTAVFYRAGNCLGV